jgi:hypothetical protein
VCGDRIRAVKCESNQSVARAWDVSPALVSHWRRVLDVPQANEGTHRLQSEWMPERLDDEARRKHAAALRTPEHAAKISAA